MRKDMAQLLVERPRYTRGELYREHRRRANRDLEEAPSKQGMRAPYFDQKEFGEYFPPVLGYLRKSVGRRWDDVFSELNSSLSGGGTVIDHVKMHVLRDFVVLCPEFHDGVACYPPHYYRGRNSEPTPITRSRNNGFYVDQQGILRQAPQEKRWKWKKPAAPNRIKIDDRTAYHKLDGVWYRVWTKPLPAPGMDVPPEYDVLLKKWVKCHGAQTLYREEMVWAWVMVLGGGIWELEELHGGQRFAYRKEQISNRTIRRERLNERLG